MIDFLMQNSGWIILVVAIALLACVGYLVEKKENKTKEKKKQQETIMANEGIIAPIVENPNIEESVIEPIVQEQNIETSVVEQPEVVTETQVTDPENVTLESPEENSIVENVPENIFGEIQPELVEESNNINEEPAENVEPIVEEISDSPVIEEEQSMENVEETPITEEVTFEPVDEQFSDITELESFGPVEEEIESGIEEVAVEEFPEVETVSEEPPATVEFIEETLETPIVEDVQSDVVAEMETQIPTEEEQEASLEEIRNIFETTVDAPVHSELTDGTGELILDNDTSIDHDFETLLNDESIEEIKEAIPEVKETKKEDFSVLDDDDEDLWKF